MGYRYGFKLGSRINLALKIVRLRKDDQVLDGQRWQRSMLMVMRFTRDYADSYNFVSSVLTSISVVKRLNLFGGSIRWITLI